MSNLDDLAKAAEEAEAANVHDRPVTDADLGETAADGAQVVIEGAAPTPVVPVMPAAAPAPEMQLPQPVAPQPEQQTPMTPITVQAPEQPAAPLPTDHAPQLTPFSEQITSETATAPAPAPASQTPPQNSAQPQMQPMQQAERPAQSSTGTMPGQTISPQTVTPQSHIITESFPHPSAGSDPLGGIAV